MNTKPAAIWFIAGVLMLPVAGHAADTDPQTTATQYVKDSVITAKIKSDLTTAGLPNGLRTLVHVSVNTDDKGAVTLSGSAPDQPAADRAVAIARAVKGVTSVENFIQIYP